MEATPCIPVRFDIIQVRYLVNDDDLVWWPGLVEDVSTTGAGSNLRSSGVIMFDSMLGHEKERVRVDFLDNQILREHRRNGSGEIPEQTSWRIEEESGHQEDSESERYTRGKRQRHTRETQRTRTRQTHTRILKVRNQTTRPTRGGRFARRNSTKTVARDEVDPDTNVELCAVREMLEHNQEHVENLHRKLVCWRTISWRTQVSGHEKSSCNALGRRRCISRDKF